VEKAIGKTTLVLIKIGAEIVQGAVMAMKPKTMVTPSTINAVVPIVPLKS
jgi:hypothetical protein